MFLTAPKFHFKFVSANCNDTKKNLSLCDKTHSMGPSKQVRHECLISKTFLLRVNLHNNRKKAFLRLGQLKHHNLIETF